VRPSRTLSAPGFVGFRDHEDYRCGVVGYRSRHSDALGVKLADPVAHPPSVHYRAEPWFQEEGKRVAFVAHANEEEVEAGQLAGPSLKDPRRSCSYSSAAFSASGILGFDAVNLFGLVGNFREHGLVGHAEVACPGGREERAVRRRRRIGSCPRKPGSGGWSRLQEGIERLGSGASGESDAERSVLLGGGLRHGDPEVGNAARDGVAVSENADVGSQKVLLGRSNGCDSMRRGGSGVVGCNDDALLVGIVVADLAPGVAIARSNSSASRGPQLPEA